MHEEWIANRMASIELSGIRRVFQLARTLKDPVNLSIGQPHFDVPEPIKKAACEAINCGNNGYTTTQGIPVLYDRLQSEVSQRLGHADRTVTVTSGTSGGLFLALMTTVNPGDEVIVFDPYFVSYPHLLSLTGGKMIVVDTHPTFEIDLDRVRAAISPKTKAIIVNSPSNPSGAVLSRETLRGLAELADRHGILLISDEIYHAFCYDAAFCSPAEFSPNVLVIDGFGKTYGMTGWRMGFAHGPRKLIDEMIKLQQFTFVCAPSMAQHAMLTAFDVDVTAVVADYRQKRDRLCAGLRGDYEFRVPGGAFYLYVKTPSGSGTAWVHRAIERNLLIIPGTTFSRHDTHFRVSYAAEDTTIDRGIEILSRLARL
jgi:aspartate aminotransferase/aminotransferase